MLLYFKNVIYKQRTYGYLQEVIVETVRLLLFFKTDAHGVVTVYEIDDFFFIVYVASKTFLNSLGIFCEPSIVWETVIIFGEEYEALDACCRRWMKWFSVPGAISP